MTEPTITCPKCNSGIKLTKFLCHAFDDHGFHQHIATHGRRFTDYVRNNL